MDEIQTILGIAVVVSAAAGYAVGFLQYRKEKQEHARCHETMGQHMMFSTSRVVKAAVDTLVEDYKANKDEAQAKLTARAAALGVALVRVDPRTLDQTEKQ